MTHKKPTSTPITKLSPNISKERDLNYEMIAIYLQPEEEPETPESLCLNIVKFKSKPL
jgi:hypothetical protein